MSKINLTPNASGTGVFTIASPNSNTDRTLNLPDKTGTINVGEGIDDNATSTAITIDSSQNVGIGTTSPINLLHLNNSAESTHDLAFSRNTTYGTNTGIGGVSWYDQAGSNRLARITASTDGGATNGELRFYTSLANSLTQQMTIDSSGNLLVGTTSTLGASSAGTTHITGGSNSTSEVPLYLRNQYSTAGYYWKTGPTNNAGYVVYNASNTGVYITYGATTWTSNSDESLKENISDVGSVIDKVKNYRCVNYSLKTSEISNADKIGFIAQDWEEDFPNVVDRSDDGILGMKYTETIPVLLKAIQEQQVMIEELKVKVAALEAV